MLVWSVFSKIGKYHVDQRRAGVLSYLHSTLYFKLRVLHFACVSSILILYPKLTFQFGACLGWCIKHVESNEDNTIPQPDIWFRRPKPTCDGEQQLFLRLSETINQVSRSLQNGQPIFLQLPTPYIVFPCSPGVTTSRQHRPARNQSLYDFQNAAVPFHAYRVLYRAQTLCALVTQNDSRS